MKTRFSRPVAALMAAGTVLAACDTPPAPSRVSAPTTSYSETSCMAEEQRYQRAATEARATEAIMAPVLRIFGDTLNNIARTLTGGVLSSSEIRQVVGELTDTIQADQLRITSYQASFDAVTACRERRAEEIRRQARRDQIDREEANARLATLRDAQERDIETARATNSEIDKRNKSYKRSLDKSRADAREVGVSQSDIAAAEASLQTNQSELVESERKVAQADARVEGTFELGDFLRRLLRIRYA
ncbi:MAG: hypothetical protein AAFR46_07635 [Pseudomonadota bacterium]